MKTISKYRPLVIGLLLAALFIALDLWAVDKELVIQSPLIIRHKIVSPVDEERWRQMIIEEEIRRKVDEKVEEILGEQKKTSSTSSPEATKAVFAAESDSTITSTINKWADHYGVSRALAHCVALNESTYNPLAVGDSGKAHGMWQWHLTSYQFMRGKMGLDTADRRFDPEDSTQTAMYAIANGYSRWWTPVLDGRCR